MYQKDTKTLLTEEQALQNLLVALLNAAPKLIQSADSQLVDIWQALKNYQLATKKAD